jgi:hypothetical protein
MAKNVVVYTEAEIERSLAARERHNKCFLKLRRYLNDFRCNTDYDEQEMNDALFDWLAGRRG